MADNLTLEDVENLREQVMLWGSLPQAVQFSVLSQLGEAMRENAELRAYPLKLVCGKCGVLTNLDEPNKHPSEKPE